MTELFWLIDPEARAKLMQFQYELYKKKLDMADRKAPWEEEPPLPEVPVRTDMDEEEMGEFIKQPPSHQEKVK